MVWFYKQPNNETIVDILMFSFFFFFFFGFEVLSFIFIVEKDKNKVLKFVWYDVFPLPWNKRPPLLSAAL